VKTQRSIAPLTALIITFFVVFIPAERSGWDFSATVDQLVFFLTTVAIYAVFCIGLNVQWGYTGVFNFGVAAFFLVGAYTAAVIVKGDPPAPDPVTGQHYVEYIGGYGDDLDLIPALGTSDWLPFVVATTAAAAAAGTLAFLLALPTLRLRGDYLAIVTIGIAELLRSVTIQEQSLVNATRGLPGIPGPLEGLFSSGDYKYAYLGFMIIFVALLFFLVERGIRSPWGRVLRAVREDELAAAASGKNPFEFKTQSFVLGAMIMGAGGAVYGYERHNISPETFTPFFATFLFWAMLILGGSGNNKGAILGAYVLYGFYFITSQLQGYSLPDWISTTRISAFRDFTVGALIVIVLLFRPQGLLPEEARVSIWVERYVGRRGKRAPRGGANPLVASVQQETGGAPGAETPPANPPI
jgi:branched-chain amino acid transport system permease protein